MVDSKIKIGFIVEGGSEKIIIESDRFSEFLAKNGFELVTPVIDAKGGSNLLPKHIEVFIERLVSQQAEKIFVLTDLEDEPNTDVVRTRIGNDAIDFIFIAVKALEAWFLADTDAMKCWLKTDDFFEDSPEETSDKPWERLKEIASEKQTQGPGNKIAFAKRMIKYWDFSVENAAKHQACPSAQELVKYFQSIK